MSVTEILPPSREMVVIEPAQALAVFTNSESVDPILERIRREIDEFTPDVSTAKGRKEIASIAYRVAQSKTYLEGVGKRLADEQKEIPKKIDATRKRIRDTLDKWRDEVRAPLTEWENAEDKRIEGHEANIRSINQADEGCTSSTQFRIALEFVEKIVVGPDCEEFEAQYARAKEAARIRISGSLKEAEKREAEAAELDRLRKAEAERIEREQIERIRREGEEKAKKEAEAKAKADREAAERRERELKEAAERAQREAKEREEKIIREAEEKRQRDALEAERRETELKRQKEEADRRAEEAEARVKREAEEARKREEEEAARREQNKRHRSKINGAAAAAFIAGGMNEESAKLAVTLIAKQTIPNVSIAY